MNAQAEHDAYVELEERLWQGGPSCPHCGCAHVSYIEPTNGLTRGTSSHRRGRHIATESVRRVWRCQGCHRQFSVLTGTPLHGCKIAASKLVEAFDLLDEDPRVSARRLGSIVGITPGAARLLKFRLLAPSLVAHKDS